MSRPKHKDALDIVSNDVKIVAKLAEAGLTPELERMIMSNPQAAHAAVSAVRKFKYVTVSADLVKLDADTYRERFMNMVKAADSRLSERPKGSTSLAETISQMLEHFGTLIMTTHGSNFKVQPSVEQIVMMYITTPNTLYQHFGLEYAEPISVQQLAAMQECSVTQVRREINNALRNFGRDLATCPATTAEQRHWLVTKGLLSPVQ